MITTRNRISRIAAAVAILGLTAAVLVPSGAIALAQSPTISSVSPSSPVLSVTSASCSSGTATLVFGSTTAPAIGTYIVVAGVGGTNFNGTFAVSNSSPTTVSYTGSGCSGSASSGGTVTVAVAKAGDVVTVYGSGFGVAEPTGGSCP